MRAEGSSSIGKNPALSTFDDFATSHGTSAGPCTLPCTAATSLPVPPAPQAVWSLSHSTIWVVSALQVSLEPNPEVTHRCCRFGLTLHRFHLPEPSR